MYKKAMAMFMLCETSVHAGSGSELGIVDLPIQRERHTDYPVFHSSSIKGALRFNVERAQEAILTLNKEKWKEQDNVFLSEIGKQETLKKFFEAVFGEKQVSNEKESFASAIAITDGRILLFPVKSLKGTFAYITCPFVLHRLKRDLSKAGLNLEGIPKSMEVKEGEALICKDADVAVNDAVTLEEFTFKANVNDEVTALAKTLADSVISDEKIYGYLRNKIKNSLVVLSDDDFKEFVSQSTEVVARIKIDEKTGTVGEGGNLWYEENLPAETILYSLIFAQDLNEGGKKKAGLENNSVSAEDVLKFIKQVIPERIQLGGNETIGRGIISVNFYNGN